MAATTDEKDRLGDTLHQKERAEEDRFFAQKDAAALARLRAATMGRAATEPEVRTPAERERTSWLGRFFHRPRSVD